TRAGTLATHESHAMPTTRATPAAAATVDHFVAKPVARRKPGDVAKYARQHPTAMASMRVGVKKQKLGCESPRPCCSVKRRNGVKATHRPAASMLFLIPNSSNRHGQRR